METKNFKCEKCQDKIFRLFYSLGVAQCDNCLAKYMLSAIMDVEIKHQRGENNGTK
jgi:hypothetical protein